MNRTKQRLHHAACFSFMLLALFLIKTDIAACAVPTLDWSGEEGLWNDGVDPDYGIKSGTGADTFTFQVSYLDADNDPPDTGYPKVHIKRIISNELDDISGSPFALTEVDPGDTNYEDGKLYSYSTTLSPAGNDYKYSFVAYERIEPEEQNDYTSPANDHTLTVVTGYVWVDDEGNDITGDGSAGNPYQTIAKGISMASSGQAVRVKAGSYSESFAMASGVHVVSDNSGGGDAQEDYENSAYYAYYGYYPKALTRANSVQLTGTITFGTLAEDVTLDGISVYNLPGSYTLDISGGSPVIKNNIIRRSPGTGRSCIEVSSSAGYTKPVIENNLLHSARLRGIGISTYTSPLIQDNEIWGTGGPGIGINCKGTPGGEITILNNVIFNNDEAGIGSSSLQSNATNQMKIVIQGNTIDHNGLDPDALRAGIGLERCCTPGPSLEIIIGGSDPSQGNTIKNNGMAGIRLDGFNLGLNPVLIQNNTIDHNDKAGIRLIDVGYYYEESGPDPPPPVIIYASIKENNISWHTKAGINIGGSTYADIMWNEIHRNYSGIAFQDGSQASSGTVNIEGNLIYRNSKTGIAVRDPITGEVTIADNYIILNDRSGISIINSCNLVINRNLIHDNQRTGIITGQQVEDDYFANSNTECTAAGEPYPCCIGPGTGTCNSSVGFIGPVPYLNSECTAAGEPYPCCTGPGTGTCQGGAFLDVSQNKVYRNGLSGYGAGINIRHASGTIYNNLIYENTRCGIKYGNYIDAIINNTVVDNGNDMFEASGVLYDSLDGDVNEWPTSGDGPSIPIRNNISALNTRTGIKTGVTVCLSNDYRDYNLLFGNNGTSDWLPPFNESYLMMQLCGCEPNDHEIFGDPQFVMVNFYCTARDIPYDCCTGAGTGTCNDYQLDTGSPGIGTGEGGIDIGAYGGPYAIDW